MNPARGLVARLLAVEQRLCGLAMAARPGLTEADPQSGERWECGQVWAHVAEFVPYWLGEAVRVAEGGALRPVPFGRTKRDPARVAAVESGRRLPAGAQLERLRGQLPELRNFLLSLDPGGWQAVGHHPTLGAMPMERIVEEFLVGHLEEHAAQLEALGSPT